MFSFVTTHFFISLILVNKMSRGNTESTPEICYYAAKVISSPRTENNKNGKRLWRISDENIRQVECDQK